MRTVAWMLGAGCAIAILSGCEDKTKGKPVEIAPPQTAAVPPQYPSDAGARHTEPMNQPPMVEQSSPPSEPPPVAQEAEPVDTAVPHKSKAHKTTTTEKPAVTTHKEQSPKESYAKPKKTGGKTYTVKKGDTLQEISQKYYGTTKNWRRIYQANRKVIGPDENKLVEGMKITIP